MTQKGFLQNAQEVYEQGTNWAGLGGDSLAFVVAQMATSGQWLLIVDEPDAAEQLVRGLRFFHPDPSCIALFSADDCRPYDGFSPSPEVVQRRLLTLDRLDRGKDTIVVVPARALVQRIPTPERVQPLSLSEGQECDRNALMQALTEMGYIATSQVTMRGYFAAMGDVLTLWPVGVSFPIRIEFFDDEIEFIRTLAPETGRPTGRRVQFRVRMAREERLDRETLRYASTRLAALTTEQGRDNRMRRRVLEDLKMSIRFSGIEAYLPALGPTVSPTERFAGLKRIVVRPLDVAAALSEFERNVRERWDGLEKGERPLVTPLDRYEPLDSVKAFCADAHRVLDLAVEGKAVDLGAQVPDGYGVRGSDLKPAVRKIKQLAAGGVRVALVCDSQRKADTLLDIMSRHDLYVLPCARPESCQPERVSLLVGELPRGFVASDSGWAFIPASALFGSRKRRTRLDRIHAFFDASVTHVSQIREGDFVVHKRHGVGIYRGLQRMDAQDGMLQDFAKIEYRNEDLFFLPVTRLGEVSRYVPSKDGNAVKLDRLGGQTWEARKTKVRDSLLSMAQELLRVASKRELAERSPYPPPGELCDAFEARFPYQETPDQLQAIQAVHEDLSGDAPMDRLLCGDVGFGKTEVAMRAAMRVVEAGKQVTVLCPTTVLAYQHFQTFRARFEPLGVRVAMLSRFQSAKQAKEVALRLSTHEVDIVIGTTAVLGRSLKIADLGMMIVDEEHRFGVKQKERMKKMRAQVDVLSMSATPIPRTLQMGLSGMREMSLMATPPQDRLSVRTSVARLTQARVKDAITHELNRQGQIFFIHNRIETIDKMTEQLQAWVPEAKFAIAHGKMDAGRLERVLLDFMERKYDVLVSTAILENGIDMPNVNTLLINRADRFGLAQLYQLRGRVGRGGVRANCLMLIPEDLTGEARRRVQIMAENTRLGSGFSIAAADLEMRGAGNLLGEAQSGNIDAVGYEVWLELLEDAVQKARGHHDSQSIEPEVEVPVQALIPDRLIPDMQERLSWYQRFSGGRKPSDIDHLLDDFEAYYGTIPEEVRHLGGLMQTQMYCQKLGIERCAWLKVRVVFALHPTSKVDESIIERLARVMPKRMKREGSQKFSIRFTPSEAERPFQFLRWILARLERESS